MCTILSYKELLGWGFSLEWVLLLTSPFKYSTLHSSWTFGQALYFHPKNVFKSLHWFFLLFEKSYANLSTNCILGQLHMFKPQGTLHCIRQIPSQPVLFHKRWVDVFFQRHLNNFCIESGFPVYKLYIIKRADGSIHGMAKYSENPSPMLYVKDILRFE